MATWSINIHYRPVILLVSDRYKLPTGWCQKLPLSMNLHTRKAAPCRDPCWTCVLMSAAVKCHGTESTLACKTLLSLLTNNNLQLHKNDVKCFQQAIPPCHFVAYRLWMKHLLLNNTRQPLSGFDWNVLTTSSHPPKCGTLTIGLPCHKTLLI